MKCPNCGAENNGEFCEYCGTALEQRQSQTQSANEKKLKKWWFWVIIAVVAIGVIGYLQNKESTDNSSYNTNSSSSDSTANNQKAKVTVVDLSSMSKKDIQKWSDSQKIICEFDGDYSNTVAKGAFISQSKKANEVIKEGDIIKIIFSLGKNLL